VRRGAVGLGWVQLGQGWSGEARRGRASQGMAGLGSARQGVVRRCTVISIGIANGDGSPHQGATMKIVDVEIVGVTALLINRFNEDAEEVKPTRRVIVKERDPAAEAEKAAYRAPDGTLYFSAQAIPRAMSDAGSSHKQRGNRKTLRYVVPSAIRMTSDIVTILDANGKPQRKFEIDRRPISIPSTKGRIMRYRPRFDAWSARFELVVNDDLLAPELAHQLLAEAGMSIGIGDFRPARTGPFGTFRVTRFDERTEPARNK
jgi:hypothetical protein